MKESKKLTISVSFNPQQNRNAKVEAAYQYHWGRIIAGVLLVVVAIGSLVGGSFYYFEKDKVTYKLTKTPLVPTVDIAPTKTASVTSIVERKPSSTTATKRAIAPLVVPDKTLEPAGVMTVLSKNIEEYTTTVEPVEPVESNVIKIDSTTTPLAEELAVSATEKRKIVPFVDRNSENNNLIQTKGKENTTDSSTSSVDNTNLADLFTQSKTAIFSDHIKRFIITSSVKTNEPVGTINDITFENNIATVYAFSEATNLKSTTLYYIWSLDGKNVAKVKVNIGGDRWRSYSSKLVQATMHGEWIVELQNGKGETLAISQFNY